MLTRRATATGVGILLAACCSHAARPVPVEDQADDDDVAIAPSPRDAAPIDAAALAAPRALDAGLVASSPWDWDRIRARSPSRQDPGPCKVPSRDTSHLECGSDPFWQLAVEVISVDRSGPDLLILVDRGEGAGLTADWLGRGVDAASHPDRDLFTVTKLQRMQALMRGPKAATVPGRMVLWNPKVRAMPEGD